MLRNKEKLGIKHDAKKFESDIKFFREGFRQSENKI